MNETGHIPNWPRIVTSDVWREELVPLLNGLIERTQCDLEKADLRDVRGLQAAVRVLKCLRDTPQQELDFTKAYMRHLAAQGLIEPDALHVPEETEETRNGRGRSGRGPVWGRRWWRKSGA